MMKSCLACLVIVAGVAAGLFVIVADPALPDQAAHAWNSVTTAVHNVTATPVPTAVPVTVRPTAAALGTAPPAAPPAPVWSVYDCAFAVDTLNEDRILDGRAYANGLSPARDPFYYAREAALWAQAAHDAAEQCQTPGALQGAACAAPVTTFGLAILSHQGDAILHPADAAWDAQWIAAYTRLEGLWTVACPGGGA